MLENELGAIVCELVLLIFPVYLISCESIRPSGDCSFSLGCVVFDPACIGYIFFYILELVTVDHNE